MKTLFTYALIGSVAMAGEVKLVWDNNPPEDLVQSYPVYERTGTIEPADFAFPLSDTNWAIVGTTYTKLTTAFTNAVTLTNVSVGPHAYVITASNFWGESLFSNEAGTVVKTGTPQGLRINVWVPPTNTVSLGFGNPGLLAVIEHSQDLEDWHPWLFLQQTDPDLYVSNFVFNTLATEPKSFWRMTRQ